MEKIEQTTAAPTNEAAPEMVKVMRETAYSKLKEIAAGFGLGFNEQELDALFRLSLAFNPPLAIAVANTACRNFLLHLGH